MESTGITVRQTTALEMSTLLLFCCCGMLQEVKGLPLRVLVTVCITGSCPYRSKLILCCSLLFVFRRSSLVESIALRVSVTMFPPL